MILFKEKFVPLILSGIKTQTRRTWRKPRVQAGSLYQCKTSYQTRPFAHVRVTNVRRQRLGEMTQEDAVAEGFASVDEFKKEFQSVYGGWDDATEVWVIEFEVKN